MSKTRTSKRDWIARWESLRASGRRRYILVHGMLGFALPVYGIPMMIRGSASPYLLHLTIGDPDSGGALAFRRKPQP
jgi:hypothetical protein